MTPEELLKLKNELYIASEELNNKIIEFQEELKKLGLGVQAWVDLSENTKLGYCRYKGKWDIYLCYDEFGETISQPVLDCTRPLRLYAYKNRMKLVEAIEEAAKSLLNRITKVLRNEQDESTTN